MKKKYFIGIDIGGTKISAGVVQESGEILSREKSPSPSPSDPPSVLETLSELVTKLFKESHLTLGAVEGIGLGVPGIVDSKGKILITPNINLSGFALCQEMEKKFKLPVAAGNDVNVGLLGEQWLGAGRQARNIVGLFPGTGIGGAVIIGGKLFNSPQGAATELGHVIMDINGPACSCGNKGCLEALAGRWAIERDIREAVKSGTKTLITDLTDGKFSVIKSKVLRQALKDKDPLVTEIIKRTSEILGLACINFRHVFDPEMIILGGGLMEACGEFMLPVIEKTMNADPFFKDISSCEVVSSVLGDDAIILGAVRLVMEKMGMRPPTNGLPVHIQSADLGSVVITDKIYTNDIYIRTDGKIKKRKEELANELLGTPRKIGPEELKKICKKKPEVMIIGSGRQDSLELTPQGREFLKEEGIDVKILSTPEAIRFYNETDKRKAILIHVA